MQNALNPYVICPYSFVFFFKKINFKNLLFFNFFFLENINFLKTKKNLNHKLKKKNKIFFFFLNFIGKQTHCLIKTIDTPTSVELPIALRVPDENLLQEHDAGELTKECPHCKALCFTKETRSFNRCCKNGAYKLKEIKTFEPLRQLFNGDHPMSKKFKHQISVK